MNETSPSVSAVDGSHLVRLLLLLSVTTGFVDAITILGLGRVFTANMTGNVVFLGFAFAGAPGFNPLPYLAAIASFLVGAAAAGRFKLLYPENVSRAWLLHASMLEAAMLWIAALIALRFDIPSQEPRAALYGILGLTGFAMGFRNGVIRQLKIPDMTTTVLTLTITGLAAESKLGDGSNTNWRRRVGSVAAIFIGALLGGLLVLEFGLSLPLALAGALALIGTWACDLMSRPDLQADAKPSGS
jgi:uncharacterized membrane protein YoaK (UPF0700 family)